MFMKIITLIFAVLLVMGCSNFQTKGLESNTQTIELEYISWACDCANWATPKDIEKFSDKEDSLFQRSVFIEPADKALQLPDTLGYNGDKIKFTGQFYVNKGYPEDYESEQKPEKAKVFRYTAYTVIKSNHKEIKEDLDRLIASKISLTSQVIFNIP
jgi:hypothetical protein